MKVVSSTDNKYLGMEVQEIKLGKSITLENITFEVQFIRSLENGNLIVGNPNYQFEISKE